MTLGELRAVQARVRAGEPLRHIDDKNPTYYQIKIHSRFALPLAPLLFAVLGMALLRRARAEAAR